MPSGANQYGIAGNWERTIGLYRTSESYISQSRKNLPDECGGVLWYGPYSATYTVYTPFAAGMKELPPQVRPAQTLPRCAEMRRDAPRCAEMSQDGSRDCRSSCLPTWDAGLRVASNR